MNRPLIQRMMRDGRNPYGSRGGYVTSRDPRRRDRARMDYARSGRRMMGSDYNYYGADYAQKRPEMEDYGYPFEVYGELEMEDYARGRNSRGQYTSDRHYYDPMYMQDYPYDYNRGYDYGMGEMLSERELMEWSKKMLKDVPDQYKNYFTIENIEKKSKEMGIDFKDFSLPELYTAVIAMFTDYYKTIGTGNMDIYIRLAKDFLCDEDSELKYGEKLSAYYDYVVRPE